jgi:Leucine-rich repeat (LRR) protein
MLEMTDEAINFCMKRKEWKRNPGSVEKLYLSNQGFLEISNLERFRGVKQLFLNRNSITRIANLEALGQLRELYLANNKIGESD